MTTLPLQPRLRRAAEPVDLARPLAPLVPAWLWRLSVAAAALGGVLLSPPAYGADWRTLPVLMGWAVGASYLALALTSLAAPRVEATVVRGMLAVAALVVAVGDGLLLQSDPGGVRPGWSVLLHVVVPALVLVDYLLLARGPVRAWHALAGLALPAAYLALHRSEDLGLYPVLETSHPDAAYLLPLTTLGILTASIVLTGLASARGGLRHPDS